MNDQRLEDLLRRTADRVTPDPGLVEAVREQGRRARRRRRLRVSTAAVTAVTVAGLLVAVPVRDWAGGDQASDATVTAQPPPSSDLAAWQSRDIAVPNPLLAGDDATLATVGRSLIAVNHEGERQVAFVSTPAGDDFGPPQPGPAPARSAAASAASATTLYLWGGHDALRGTPLDGASYPASGAAFDVATQTWSQLPPAPIQPRDNAVAVWTGSTLLVWGGTVGAVPSTGTPSRVLPDGAAYDPAAGTWDVLPLAPADGLTPVAAVWTGERMVVWAHPADGTSTPGSGRTLEYDPAAGDWSQAPGPPVPTAGASLVATSNGPLAVSVLMEQSHAALFDAAAGRWVTSPTPSVPAGTICPTTVLAVARPAAVVAVPHCAAAVPQLLDETSGNWVELPSWGTAATAAAVAGEGFVALRSPPPTPGSASSLRVMSV